MKHIVLTSNTAKSIYNFRAPLIRALRARDYKVTVIAKTDEYKQFLTDMGCDYVELPIDPNGCNPIKDMKTLWFYFKTLKVLKPDVLISYTIKCVIYAGFAARSLKIPYFSVITGLGSAFMQENWVTKLVRLFYKFSQKKAKKVLFLNTADQKEFLDSHIIQREQAFLLPSEGVDTAHFYFTELPQSDKITFLYSGRLLIDKGLRDYYQAAKILKEKYDACFQILGPLEEPQRSVISKSELDRWVDEGVIEYLGSTEDVRPYIEKSHCIVLPTYYKEGLPRCLLEGASMGRAMIATHIPGCTDLVKDSFNGYLSEAKNVDSLVAQMAEFIELPFEKRSAMALNARNDVVERFRIERVIDNYMALLS